MVVQVRLLCPVQLTVKNMRLLKCITKGGKRISKCPYRPSVFLGEAFCMQCCYFAGHMRNNGTVAGKHGDGLPLTWADINFLDGVRASSNMWWYIRCTHPTNLSNDETH